VERLEVRREPPVGPEGVWVEEDNCDCSWAACNRLAAKRCAALASWGSRGAAVEVVGVGGSGVGVELGRVPKSAFLFSLAALRAANLSSVV